MEFPYFSQRRSLWHCRQVKIFIIFVIVGSATTGTKTIAAIANASILAAITTDYSNASLISQNDYIVELPKPMVLSSNRKHFVDLNEAAASPMPKRQQRAHSHRPTLMDVALQASAREGLDAMTQFYGKIVPNIIRNGHVLEDNHPAALLSKFSESIGETLEQEMAAYATISATKAFRKNYKYFNELARQAHNAKISLRHTALEGLCPPRDPPTCMPASARYRTHDGTCNSRRRPRWGAAQMPFNRFLPPEYGDGVDSVRMSLEGGPLASSRFVSLLVHGARDGEATVTLMTAQWGQLLDHDMTSTAQPRSINGSVPSCCGNTDFHPSCFPIKVPLDDPWLAPLKVRCLEFLRSAPAQRRDCILSWREQTNQATSYIDASPIYSNSVKSSDKARVFRNGLLVYGRGNPNEDVCQRGAISSQCIRAGDGRSGEQPGLLALHHVWVGEHNRIAMELSEMNLHWSDEKIYQETRRIVGAMFQHITYREFLPIVLGREVCKLFDLELLNVGYYKGYDPKTNPTVANSFAAAAFRFGHSLVQNSYMRCDRFHNFMRNNVSLHEEFQRGDIGSAGSLHRLLRGLINQRALKRDEFITPELTNHLFQTPGFPFGLDLAAINIQRGRDHGTPPYTSWRVPCGLTPVNSWEDFANVVGPQSAHRISHAYRSVHDIDLFVGGIAERPVVGGLVGPTFACIIAQQFSNSRKGDRFWYENGDFENSFTPAQLHSIRRISLAQILCRAVGGGTMQPHVFLPTEIQGNERQICGTGALAPLDLRPWIEQDPFETVPTTPVQQPEHVFNIITTDNIKETAATSTVQQVLKENKVGFPNRLRPTDNRPSATVNNGFASGIQVPGEIVQINDKLDIRQKPKPVKRPTVTAKPINGINNKLDKKPLITLNIKGVTVRRPQGTRHTTVVVNNIPVELRNAAADETTSIAPRKTNTTTSELGTTTKTQSTSKNMNVDKVEARIDDSEHESGLLLNELLTAKKDKEITKRVRLEENQTDSNLTYIRLATTSFHLNEKTTREPMQIVKQISNTQKDFTETENERKLAFEVDQRNNERITNTEKAQTDATLFNGDLISEQILTTNSEDAKTELTANSDATRTHGSLITEIDIMTTTATTKRYKDAHEQEATKSDVTPMDIELTTHSDKQSTANSSRETDKTGPNNEPTAYEALKPTTENPFTFKNSETEQTTEKQNAKASIQTIDTDMPEVRYQTSDKGNEEVKQGNIDNSKTANITENTTLDSLRTTADINPLEQLPPIEEQKRLKRRRPEDNRKLIVNWRNETKTRLNIKTTKSANFKQSTAATPLTNLTKRSTSRLVELRQYQTPPTYYTRPQKLVVNGPNADQYEIEINIKQTNKQSSSALPLTGATNPYANFATSYKPHGYDRYSQSYVGTYYSSTLPPHAFYQNTPTPAAYNAQTRRTKPPTVIYIDEHEDHYTTTTRSPGVFQNIIAFGANGLANWNKPAQSSPHSTSAKKEQQTYGSSVSNIQQHNQIYAPNADTSSSSVSHYVPRPSAQNALAAYPAVPSAASLNQIGGMLNSGGIVQATSSAISTGNFGTITGVAHANGADSTFSFNIRPKPSVVGQSQLPLPPNQINAGSYGLAPSRNPSYGELPNPSFANIPQSASVASSNPYYGNTHKQSTNSPFSSANKGQQQGTYGYYNQIQNLPLQKKTELFLSDYDEIGIERTLEPNKNNNETNDDSDTDNNDKYDDDDDDDYDYSDDSLTEKFDRDGYVRPQHMINALIKSKENELNNLTTNKNRTTKPLDDNYVLPILNTTTDSLKSNNMTKTLNQSDNITTTMATQTVEDMTNFTDIEAKHLNNDILAEDFDDETTESLFASKVHDFETLVHEQQNSIKTEIPSTQMKLVADEKIAFAPIQILTKLERPDNWIIYDSPKNYTMLPDLPAMNADSSAPSDEIPTPIKDLPGMWLKKTKKQKHKNREQFSVTETPARIETTIADEVDAKFKSAETFTTISPSSAALA